MICSQDILEYLVRDLTFLTISKRVLLYNCDNIGMTVRAGFTYNGDQCKPSFSVSSTPKSLQIENIFKVCLNFFTKEIVNTKKFGKTFTEDD